MKVCFVGTGSIGRRHIKNLRFICSEQKIPLRIDVLRSSHTPIDEVVPLIDYEYFQSTEMKMDYDAVFITNPTVCHYETVKELCHHSKNFFVEKPVFADLSSPPKSLELPAENLYYVACPLRYDKILKEARKFVRSHNIYSARAICSSYLPQWRLGQDYRNTYSASKKMGGGVCIDLIHEWDYLQWMFGRPQEVKMIYGKLSELEIDSEDIAIYIARYEQMFLELHLDYFGRHAERKLELYCQEGKFEFDIIQGTVKKGEEILEEFKEVPNEKYIRELKNFLKMINGEQKSVNNLEQAYETMKIALCEG